MTVRLKVTEDDEAREFVFDRSEISVGCAAFNDIVLESGDGAEVHGRIDIDDETIQFASGASEVPTSVLREGTCISTVGGDEESTLAVRVGDTIRLGSENPADLEIVELAERAPGRSFETQSLSETARVRPGSETSRLLWQAMSMLSDDSSVERLLRAVGSVFAAVTEERPTRLTLSFLEDRGEVEAHVYSLNVPERPDSEPSDDEQGGYQGDGVLLEGSYSRKRAPLVGLGLDRRDIVAAIQEGDQFAVHHSGGETSIFVPVGDEEFRGVVDLRFEEFENRAEFERVGLAASLIQPMGRITLESVAREIANMELAEENRYFRQRERRHYLFKDLVCESDQMREVYQVLNDWVSLQSPVLIEGEAGSGKSLMARALHHLGPRTDGMLISLDCRSLSAEVLDSELFGCVESELVGAVAPRKGVFELADEGTVFLEEVDHLSAMMQGKLLRVLKEGEVRRIGDAVGRKVRARLIASTHRDLASLVERGEFRRDLYLILQEHVLTVPPLRERRADIVPLARVFLRKFADRYERECTEFDDEVVERLENHDWLGNARELKAVVEAAVLNADGDDVVRTEQLSL